MVFFMGLVISNNFANDKNHCHDGTGYVLNVQMIAS